MTNPPTYLLWSNEHGGWWKAGGWGYTLDHRDAARYGRAQAVSVVYEAGAYGPYLGVPNETMHLAPECRWQGGPPDPFDTPTQEGT